MSKRNPFGGKNANFAYVPLTDVEQEVLARLVASGDLVVSSNVGQVILTGAGHGDHLLSLRFRMEFDGLPEAPTPLFFMDLSLSIGQNGRLLFKERVPTVYNGQPQQVCNITVFDAAWDIGLHSLDPALVKDILPNVTGLTSRRIDKDTGFATFAGNMKLDADKRHLLKVIQEGEQNLRRDAAQTLAKTLIPGRSVVGNGLPMARRLRRTQ